MIVYLASPYGHHNEEVVKERMRLFSLCLISLHKAGVTVISPLLTTVIGQHLKADEIPELTYQEWEDDCRRQLAVSDAMIWIASNGWQFSKGLCAEKTLCHEMQKPVAWLAEWEVSDQDVINTVIQKIKERYGR